MKYLIAALFALAVVLIGLVPSVHATDCRFAPQRQVVVVQKQVLVAVPFTVPLYSVGYDPYTGRLTEEIQRLREELLLSRPQVLPQQADAIKVLPPRPATPMEKLPPPETPEAPPEPQAVLQRNCAACHTGESSKKGLQIFTAPGQLADVSAFQLWDIAEQKKMPPGNKPKLTDSELTTLRQWVRESVAAKGK